MDGCGKVCESALPIVTGSFPSGSAADIIAGYGLQHLATNKYVKLWAFGVEIGFYKALNDFLHDFSRRTVKDDGETLDPAFRSFRALTDQALVYEQLNGDGSLRKLEHKWWQNKLYTEAKGL